MLVHNISIWSKLKSWLKHLDIQVTKDFWIDLTIVCCISKLQRYYIKRKIIASLFISNRIVEHIICPEFNSSWVFGIIFINKNLWFLLQLKKSEGKHHNC